MIDMGSEGCCLIGTLIPTHKLTMFTSRRQACVLNANGKFVPRGIVSSAHIRTASVMAKELDKGGGLDIHKKSVAAAIASEITVQLDDTQVFLMRKALLELTHIIQRRALLILSIPPARAR